MNRHPQPESEAWPLVVPVLIALAISVLLYLANPTHDVGNGTAAYRAGVLVGRLSALPGIVAVVIVIRNSGARS